MIKTIHMFWSGQVTAEVLEVASDHGLGYSLAIHRSCPETTRVETLFVAKGQELHDIRAVVDSALGLIEHLLDGGSHEAWCNRRGYRIGSVANWGGPLKKEPADTS
ncbi:MAG: hypothetical protein GX616_21130 [Planctomycetes bacterium]|nr:hypothetical protein [Planctomycetota bacterium]